MTEKFHDPEYLRNLADDIDAAAYELDATGSSMPDELDAGPLTELVNDLFESACANTTALVIRMHETALNCREASGLYSDAELENLEGLRGLEDSVDVPLPSPLSDEPPGPLPAPRRRGR